MGDPAAAWENTSADVRDLHRKLLAGDVSPQPSDEPKFMSIFEPNLDVVKYCIPCVLACELVQRKRPELVKRVNITNTQRIRDQPAFKAMMNQLDIVRQNKAMFGDRFNIVEYLGRSTDIVVSHQWANPLNYLYLDVLYCNYPLVHNASMIADMGYYYKGFNLESASKQIIRVCDTHDRKHKAKEADIHRKLKRFFPTNPDSRC